ncbi:MAG TPA: hypothetical protein VFC99_00935 [Acidimicrobiia bacterium]|nr:hypothetical protein [Acidimicrobiia bacterium]
MMRTPTRPKFAGSAVDAEQLIRLGEFLAPQTHFVSEDHLREAAGHLAEWADDQPSRLWIARDLAVRRGCRGTVVDVLHQAGLGAPRRLVQFGDARAS